MNCDTYGCDEKAAWIDEMENFLCDDCLVRDMEETGNTSDDYVLLAGEEDAN